MRAHLFLLLVLATSTPVSAGAPFVLPVAGEWLAVEGPPCPAAGDLCSSANTRFALRLMPLDAFGRPASTCLGHPVLSPGEGVVVETYDAYPNFAEAGQHRFGNRVVIAGDDGGTIVLGSLARGSVTVAVGARLVAGAAVAACGFSGAVERPGLHVHMQAGRDILDADSAGLAMRFSNLSVRTPGGCYPTSFLYRGQGTC